MTTIHNYVTLIGRIASEKWITEFPDGNKIVRFQIDAALGDERDVETSTFFPTHHKVFAWGNVAQFIEQYGQRGKKILIQGRVVSRSYLSPKGKQRTVCEIEIRHVLEIL